MRLLLKILSVVGILMATFGGVFALIAPFSYTMILVEICIAGLILGTVSIPAFQYLERRDGKPVELRTYPVSGYQKIGAAVFTAWKVIMIGLGVFIVLAFVYFQFFPIL